MFENVFRNTSFIKYILEFKKIENLIKEKQQFTIYRCRYAVLNAALVFFSDERVL